MQVAATLLMQPATGHINIVAGALPGEQPSRSPRSPLNPGLLGNPMNMMAPMLVRAGCAGTATSCLGSHGMGEDLMTRRQVASRFGVTSAAVATWARRGRLPEVRDEDGKPRYRRADVEALFRRGAGWKAR